MQIYFQGFLDTGCFLYTQANAYKALTGKRVTQETRQVSDTVRREELRTENEGDVEVRKSSDQ